jgi:hypothetical protein
MVGMYARSMNRNESRPGEPAPGPDLYEELNVFGSPTGKVVVMVRGETFPVAPHGFTWRALSELSVSELRAKARLHRAMAATAATDAVMVSLLKLAARFDALADQRDGRPS